MKLSAVHPSENHVFTLQGPQGSYAEWVVDNCKHMVPKTAEFYECNTEDGEGELGEIDCLSLDAVVKLREELDRRPAPLQFTSHEFFAIKQFLDKCVELRPNYIHIQG